jgi:hypothetical protein
MNAPTQLARLTEPWHPNSSSINRATPPSPSHAWFEFEYDLSNIGMTGPYPVIIRAEMTGPGWNAAEAGIRGVPGEIDITVWPTYGEGGRSLPKHSTDSNKYRDFPGDAADAQRLVDWLDKNTTGSFPDTLRQCFSQPGEQVHLQGAGDFKRYGVPAFGGRQHCSTFAGFGMSEYTQEHWLSLFPFGPLKIMPEGLMLGPIGPPWNLYPDLSLPSK